MGLGIFSFESICSKAIFILASFVVVSWLLYNTKVFDDRENVKTALVVGSILLLAVCVIRFVYFSFWYSGN